MTTYNRPQTMKLLRTKGIPLELIDIINSYAFNSYIQVHQTKMNEIVKEINYGCYFSIRDNIFTRRWGFRSSTGRQFHSSFCIQCGDYSDYYERGNLNECVLCVCEYSGIDEDRFTNQQFEDEEYYYV